MTSSAGRVGSWPFAEALTSFAEDVPAARLQHLAKQTGRPLGVAVAGRSDVGRRTVELALRRAGARIAPAGAAEVRVLVVAESYKQEDAEVVATVALPTLVVLTKADVIGSASAGTSAGPLAHAAERAAAIEGRTGLPTVAVVGLLATLTELDDELVAALRTLVTTPAELRSVDAFVDAAHPLPREVRARLLERLDRFGIAHAVLALHDGNPPAAVVRRLRALSNVDGMLAGLAAVAAVARYRRVQRALHELRCSAMTLVDMPARDAVVDFLSSDDTALAVMAAAVDVVEGATGVLVDRTDTPEAHERRAVQWSRYGGGPVNALHRQCAADLTRGSLRLLHGADRGR